MRGFHLRSVRLFFLLCGLVTGLEGLAVAQDAEVSPRPDESSKQPWLFIGARVGVTYDFTSRSAFNAAVQEFFPSANSYFPLFSQLGAAVTERVAIGDTGYRLIVNELLGVSGLDQNFALPFFTLLVGVETGFGLEAALGPQLDPFVYSGKVVAAPSLVYSVGWRFNFGGISVPIALVAYPLPPDRSMRLSILGGVDFGIAPGKPKSRAPFNY